jgi:hypothetical protein
LILLVSPGFATQYLVWPVAFGFLLDPRWATAYSVAAGTVLFETYTHWGGGFPWYYSHFYTLFDHVGAVLGMTTWLLLIAMTAATGRGLLSGGPPRVSS